jgi:hypothetical protein
MLEDLEAPCAVKGVVEAPDYGMSLDVIKDVSVSADPLLDLSRVKRFFQDVSFHGCFSFLNACASGVARNGKGASKSQHDSLTPWSKVCGGLVTAAYGLISNDGYHLLSMDGFWTDLSPPESLREVGVFR